jgi:serine protease Do
MELDITFNPGTSGGASFTCDGTVIGINVAKGPGLGFIIPIDVVRQIEQHMDKFKTASYGALVGVIYVPVHLAGPDDLQKFGITPGQNDTGILITEVRPNSAAHKAGLDPGDIVTAIDGMTINQPYRFARKVFYTPPGEKLFLSIRKKNGREVRLSVTVGVADSEMIKSVASQLNLLDREL